MLVLSRKRGETIEIGDRTVVVTVVEIRGDKVRLGIEADVDIPVHRGEVADRMREEEAAMNESEGGNHGG